VILLSEAPAMAALIVDGRLEDICADPEPGVPTPGQIYRAVVDRTPTQGGAFVRLTPVHRGFMRDAYALGAGRTHLVQVHGFAEPGKAAPVTTRVVHKGRFVILTPGAPGMNVSRRVRGEARRAAATAAVETAIAAAGVDPAEHGGLIVRAAALAAGTDELAADIRRVFGDAAEAADRLRASGPPLDRAVAGHRVAHVQALDEWAEPEPDAIYANDPALLPSARNNPLPLAGVGALEARIRHHDAPDLLDHFGVPDAIERLCAPATALPSGGSMSIEATRAMVAVDVNAGATFDFGAAMTANVEAARDLPRQLRLRGLGGQIAIDFAPLRKMHRKKIEEALKAAFRRDPIATNLAGWTPLGNFELTRKRERQPLADSALVRNTLLREP